MKSTTLRSHLVRKKASFLISRRRRSARRTQREEETKSGQRSIRSSDRTDSKQFGIISKLRDLVKIFSHQFLFVEIFILIQLVGRLSSNFILFHFQDFNLPILESLIKLEYEFLFVDRVLYLFIFTFSKSDI